MNIWTPTHQCTTDDLIEIEDRLQWLISKGGMTEFATGRFESKLRMVAEAINERTGQSASIGKAVR